MDPLLIATFGAALGCGVIAGVFFAFSTFVMPALVRVEAQCGLEAMQAINVTVLTPWFLGLFVGLAPLCLGLGVVGVMRWGTSGAAALVIGALLYLVGTFVETAAIHVPMNEALERVEAESPEAEELWARYASRWTGWNHVRTVASLLAAAAFTVALL